jgi:hypothetical protein
LIYFLIIKKPKKYIINGKYEDSLYLKDKKKRMEEILKEGGEKIKILKEGDNEEKLWKEELLNDLWKRLKEQEKEVNNNNNKEHQQKKIDKKKLNSRILFLEGKIQRAIERKEKAKIKEQMKRGRRPPNYSEFLGFEGVRELEKMMMVNEKKEKENEELRNNESDVINNNNIINKDEKDHTSSPCFNELSKEEQKEITAYETMTKKISKPPKKKISPGRCVCVCE